MGFNADNIIRLQLNNKFIWRIAPAQPDNTTGNQNSLLLPYYISTGCSLIRCRTNKFETQFEIGRNQNGYIIALTRTDLSTTKPEDILDSDITYGIQVASTPSEVRRYWTIVDGVFTLDAKFPEYQGNGDTNNDHQEVSINFGKVELNVYQNSTGARKIALADFPYTSGEPTEIADAFLIELLNLKCESYDGFLKQRKNILAVIPKSNANGEVIYETNTPFFIDLNNAKDLLLRNLKCRVVRPDYSVLKMRGLATMVLLIDT